jgi:hypothetical protein
MKGFNFQLKQPLDEKRLDALEAGEPAQGFSVFDFDRREEPNSS